MVGKLNDADFKVTKVQEEETGFVDSFRLYFSEFRLHDVTFGVTKNQSETTGIFDSFQPIQRIRNLLHQANLGVTKNQEETEGVQSEGFFEATIARIIQTLSEVVGIDYESNTLGGVQIVKEVLNSILGVSEKESKTAIIQPKEVLSIALQIPLIAMFFRSFIEVSGIVDEGVDKLSKFRTRVGTSVMGTVSEKELTVSKLFREDVGAEERFSTVGTFIRPLTEVSGIIDGRINNLSKFRTRVATSIVGVVEDKSLKPVQTFKERVGVEGRVFKVPGKGLSESIGVITEKAYRITLTRLEIIGVRNRSDVGVGKEFSEAIAPARKVVFGVGKQVSEAVSIRSRASFFYRAVNLGEVVGLIDERTVQPILQRSSVIGVQDVRQSGVGKRLNGLFTGEQSVTFGATKQIKRAIGLNDEADTVKTFGLIIRQSVGVIDRKISKPIITFSEQITPERETRFGVTKGISQGVGVSDTVARVRTRVIRVAQSIGAVEKRAMGLTRTLTETISPEQPISKRLRRTFQETIIGSDFDKLRVIKNPVVRQVRTVGSNILTILDSGLSRFRVFNTVNVQRVLNPRNQIMIFEQAREARMTESENSVRTFDRQNDVETFDQHNES